MEGYAPSADVASFFPDAAFSRGARRCPELPPLEFRNNGTEGSILTGITVKSKPWRSAFAAFWSLPL